MRALEPSTTTLVTDPALHVPRPTAEQPIRLTVGPTHRRVLWLSPCTVVAGVALGERSVALAGSAGVVAAIAVSVALAVVQVFDVELV